jgi:TolB-like protein
MKRFFTLLSWVFLSTTAFTQTQTQTIAILDFDNRNYPEADVNQLIQKGIVDLIRINQFEVVDKYDIEYISKRDEVELKGCFSKICLADIGKRLDCDFILTGNMDRLGSKVSFTYRLYDVKEGRFTKSASQMYLDIPEQALLMAELTLNSLLGIENDPEMMKKLTISEEYENMLNNPDAMAINNTGPRLGYTFILGSNSKILTSNEPGGFGYWSPSMFSFGFQFEQVFINSGDFQALVEVVPMVAGIEYGKVVPSLTGLMGMRNSRTGWEFAIGPNVTSTTVATGYYANDGTWMMSAMPSYDPTGKTLTTRLDSRGEFQLSSGLMVGLGKTFKSGRMNYPVNLFIIPPAKGNTWRVGVSTGFNIIQKKKTLIYE